MATTAAKAIWGSSPPTTEEPVSGRQGDISKGEPYDAGNIEPTSETAGEEAVPNEPPTSRPVGDTDVESAKQRSAAAESKATPQTPTEPQTSAPPSDPDAPTPQDLGPGPRPIEEVAKEHDGDAAGRSARNQTTKPPSKSTVVQGGGEGPNDNEAKTEGDEDEQPETKVTEEHYGGDGAGKEADKEQQDAAAADASQDDSGGPSGKRSIGQKIKEKLHRH